MKLIIAGSGPSIVDYSGWDDTDIMAVSSGYMYVPHITHFCSLDKSMCFPKWLTANERFVKHVPDWKWAPTWASSPKVEFWPYTESEAPTFSGPIASGGLTLANGQPRHNSLLFALQVAARLGYTDMQFIGVDLLTDYNTADMLSTWEPAFREHNITWTNISPLSTLCEWMTSGF